MLGNYVMTEFQREHVRFVSENLSKLLQCDSFLDVTIAAHGFELKSNRLLLSASSGYFRSLFDFYEEQQSSTPHYDISSQYVTVEGLQFIIRFLHTLGQDWKPVAVKDYEMMYATANYLQINALQSLFRDLIVQCTTPSSVLGALRLASLFDDSVLYEKSMMILTRDFFLIDIFSDDFLQLTEEQIQNIFMSDQVDVPTEAFMVKALISWLCFDVNGRMEFFRKTFVRLLRLPLVKAADLRDLAANPRFVEAQEAFELLLRTHQSLCGVSAVPNQSASVALAASQLHLTNARIGANIRIYAVGGLEDIGEQDIFGSNGHQTPAFYSYNTNLEKSKPHDNPEEPSRVYHAVAASLSWLYVTGGETGDGEILDHCAKYSFTESKWFPMASLDTPRSDHSLVSVESYLYGFGGYSFDWDTADSPPTDSIFMYDSIFDKWTLSTHRLPFVGVNIGAVLLPSKRLIMLVGGLHEHGNEMRPSDCVVLYDPAEDGDNCFISLPNLPFPLVGVALVSDEAGNQVFACGGMTDAAHASHAGVMRGYLSERVLQFSFDSRSWSTITYLTCPRYHATALIHNSTLFILGGVTVDDADEFEARTVYNESKALSMNVYQDAMSFLSMNPSSSLQDPDPDFIIRRLFSNYRRPNMLYAPYRPCHFMETFSFLRSKANTNNTNPSDAFNSTPLPCLQRYRLPLAAFDVRLPWFGRCLSRYCIAPFFPMRTY